MSKVLIPENLTGKELFDFLIKNKSKLIAQKKASIKYTDVYLGYPQIITTAKSKANKVAGKDDDMDIGVIRVKVVGNTAWWCDSQMDVLTDTCYDKSIKEKGTLIPHIADHVHLSTNHVGDVKDVYTQKMSLRDLGLDMDGKTTAFIMETDVREDYNEDTYKFYKNGKINQHSIGLIYVSIGMCINDKDYLPEYEMWQKYYEKVINKDVVDEYGYFWIVPEIKIMENSCVLFGANELTPTLETSDTEDAAGKSATENQPSNQDKQMVICPKCQNTFKAPDNGPINCPDCGQFVSPESTTTVIETFDTLSAIANLNFFNN
jgi:hypothetical protein